ncbi:hypothetical protein [Curtobacterium sp. MCBD17_003]|uniref:hypothetical protein n=1 Tax=Curtobacterium sp. MCBD17_003 TaxID=2175667 RepID=UPI000DA9EA24|nr:hypothetical protein [Curtobacterium sp. MCBD17_003]WIE55019.1 hypothetical protein DEI88_002070 [Curtobacterium sp. MCBD17_003]
MADRLLVDLMGLGELERDLTTVHRTLERAHKQVDASDDEIGSRVVQGALHDFDHRWEDKRRRITDSTAALAAMLTTSERAYRETDAHLASALRVDDQAGGPTAAGSAQ